MRIYIDAGAVVGDVVIFFVDNVVGVVGDVPVIVDMFVVAGIVVVVLGVGVLLRVTVLVLAATMPPLVLVLVHVKVVVCLLVPSDGF